MNVRRIAAGNTSYYVHSHWHPWLICGISSGVSGTTISLRHKTKKTVIDGLHFVLVGVRRFELPASWSRTKRSTKLSHTPLFHNTYIIAKKNGIVNSFFAIFWKTGKFFSLAIPNSANTDLNFDNIKNSHFDFPKTSSKYKQNLLYYK